VLRVDVYATAALAGSAVMVVVRRFGAPPAWSAVLGGAVCLGLRLVSVWQHWRANSNGERSTLGSVPDLSRRAAILTVMCREATTGASTAFTPSPDGSTISGLMSNSAKWRVRHAHQGILEHIEVRRWPSAKAVE
jgi:hypothetical protein